MNETKLIFATLIIAFILLCSTTASTKTDPFVKDDGDEHETDLEEKDVEEADKMEPLTAKKLKEMGIDVPKTPTLGEETEGDLLNVPSKRGRRKRENREVILARRSKRQTDLSGSNEYFETSMQMRLIGVRYPTVHLDTGEGVGFHWQTWVFGEIPYKLSSSYEPWARADIAKAMLEIEDKTAIDGQKCIKFIPYEKTPEKIVNGAHTGHLLEYLVFHEGNRADNLYIRPGKNCEKKGNCCSSSAGKVEDVGKQRLMLDQTCIGIGTILHELLHALGLFHEQSRHDRDKYVEILHDNIIEGRESQFTKHYFYPIMCKGMHTASGAVNVTEYPTWETQREPLTEYDFESIMHYPADAFAKDNTSYTIVPKDKKLAENKTFMENLGYREHLSKSDVEQLRHLYKCYFKKNPAAVPTTPAP